MSFLKTLSPVILVFIISASATADLLVTYNTVGTDDLLDPTIVDGSLVSSATEMSLGSGAILHRSKANDDFFDPLSDSTYLRYVGQNGTLQTKDEAIANNQHFDISMEIAQFVAFDIVSFQARVNVNNPATNDRHGALTYHWQGSVNGDPFTDLGDEIFWDADPGNGNGDLEVGEHQANAKQFSVDISSLGTLAAGDQLTLRLVFRNGDNEGGGGDGNGAVRFGDINIYGTAAIPEPSTFGICLASILLIGSFQRRRR